MCKTSGTLTSTVGSAVSGIPVIAVARLLRLAMIVAHRCSIGSGRSSNSVILYGWSLQCGIVRWRRAPQGG